MKKHYSGREILKALCLLVFIGVLSYLAEKFGEGHMTELVRWVGESGSKAPMFFVLCNVLGLVLAIPQTLFTVAAGLLFGTLKGFGMSLVGMAGGSTLAFLLGRFVLRERILRRFSETYYFQKIERLSKIHPLKVLALSRVVPVLPYSVVNYIWSVTAVRFLPFILMSLVCMVPETVFLTAGGHLLQTGVVMGRVDWTVTLVLIIAGMAVLVLIREVRKGLD